MPLPWFPRDDAFTLQDRIRAHLGESETWARFSGPVGKVLLACSLLAGITAVSYGVATIVSQPAAEPEVRVARMATIPLPTATPTVAPPAQVVEQDVEGQVWRSSSFAWPIGGRIAAFFGLGDPTGLTIETEPGATVLASARGVVKSLLPSVGGRSSIVIEHDGGMSTAYGNLVDTLVSVGQRIDRRQPIAKAGQGRGGRGQIHFEMIFGAEALDPLRYLPASAPDPVLATPDSIECPGEAFAVDPASTLNFIFTSEALRSYTVKEASVKTAAGASQRDIEARNRGQLSLTVDVHPRPAGSSGSAEYILDVIFSNGTDLRSSSCSLTVVTPTLIPAGDPGDLTVSSTPVPQPAALASTPGTTTTTPSRTGTVTPTGTQTPGTPTKTATAKHGAQTKTPTRTKTPRRGSTATPVQTGTASVSP
jgi:murein DD-endopeptidase MepM/ murein hydrolase activator NlpD